MSTEKQKQSVREGVRDAMREVYGMPLQRVLQSMDREFARREDLRRLEEKMDNNHAALMKAIQEAGARK